MAYAQIDSMPERLTLDEKSPLTVQASARDYAGAMAVQYRLSLSVGDESWVCPSLSPSGSFACVPPMDLIRGFPGANRAEGTLKVEMVSATGSLGASATAPITLLADETKCLPILESGWVALSADNSNTLYPNDLYVQSSRIQARFDLSKARFQYGASAHAQPFQIQIGSRTARSDDILFTGDVLSLTLPNEEDVSVICTLWDSRGFAARETFKITTHAYAPPCLSHIEIFRSDSGGNADESGGYIAVKAAAHIADLSGENAIAEFYADLTPTGSQTATRTPLTGETMALLGGGDILPNQSYRIYIHLADGCGGLATYETILATARAAFSLRPGGNGAAFGKLSEKANTLDAGNWNIETLGNLAAANFFPLGSVYMSAYEADPASLYGGTWSEVNATGLPFHVWFRNG